MARSESDANHENPRVVPPEPWTEEEPATRSLDDDAGDVVDEAFDWSRGTDDDDMPMPPPPPMTEEESTESPPPPEDPSSPEEGPATNTVPAPSWTSVEPIVTEPPAGESTTASTGDADAVSPSDLDVGRHRPVTEPQSLTRVEPADIDWEAVEAMRALERWDPDAEELEPIDVDIDEDTRKKIAERVAAEQLKTLNSEVSRLYDAVEEHLSSSKKLSHEALRKISEARRILLSEPGLFPLAELRVEEARVMLRRAENSERDADTHASRIFAFNMAWVFILLALAIFDRGIAQWFRDGLGIAPPFAVPLTENGTTVQLTMAMYFLPWFCMIWGGIGGAIGALYRLRTYIADREFDQEYVIHYYAHAPMGAVLGAVVYFMFIGGFFVVGAVSQTTELTNPAQQVLTATSPLLILIALSFGLVQEAVYEMIDRVVQTVMGTAEADEEEESADTTTPAPTPAGGEGTPTPQRPGSATT